MTAYLIAIGIRRKAWDSLMFERTEDLGRGASDLGREEFLVPFSLPVFRDLFIGCAIG